MIKQTLRSSAHDVVNGTLPNQTATTHFTYNSHSIQTTSAVSNADRNSTPKPLKKTTNTDEQIKKFEERIRATTELLRERTMVVKGGISSQRGGAHGVTASAQ
jgi:hypothetical protein